MRVRAWSRATSIGTSPRRLGSGSQISKAGRGKKKPRTPVTGSRAGVAKDQMASRDDAPPLGQVAGDAPVVGRVLGDGEGHLAGRPEPDQQGDAKTIAALSQASRRLTGPPSRSGVSAHRRGRRGRAPTPTAPARERRRIGQPACRPARHRRPQPRRARPAVEDRRDRRHGVGPVEDQPADVVGAGDLLDRGERVVHEHDAAVAGPVERARGVDRHHAVVRRRRRHRPGRRPPAGSRPAGRPSRPG